MRPTRKQFAQIDLTALADVAWLLLVFFILTTRFKAPNPHEVDLPTKRVTEYHHGFEGLRVIFNARGQVWLRFSQQVRLPLLDAVERKYGQPVDPKRAARFIQEDEIAFGPEGLLATEFTWNNDRGIDDANVIADWTKLFKDSEFQGGITIFGDQMASYATVEKIFSAISRGGVNRFNLLTTLEKDDFEELGEKF